MWTCEACGERHEEAFSSCWNCGGERKEIHGGQCACARCGGILLPENTSWTLAAPDDYWKIAEKDRDSLTALTPDQCILADRLFYLSGNLDLPIQGTGTSIRFTCWVRIDPETHERIAASWNDPERVREEPHAGELANDLPHYPPTSGLAVEVVQNAPGIRPTFALVADDHPLTRDFREGLPPERAESLRRHLDAQF